MANITGTTGADRLQGTGAADTINGLGGDDILFAAGGNDLLRGGAGSDVLRGDAGNDTLDGGLGNDLLIGGAGIDTVDYSAATDRVSIDLLGQGASGALGSDVFQSIEIAIAGSGDDFIVGGTSPCALFGLAGDDFMVASGGDTQMRGGAGDDLLSGRAGNDRLWGDEGDDLLNGNGGDDVIHGGAGSDAIFGGSGNQRVFGDEGDDLVSYDFIPADDSVQAFGGAGADRIELFRGHANRLDGGDGNDELVAISSENTRLIGGAGADSFNASEGEYVLTGGPGSDEFGFFGASAPTLLEITDFDHSSLPQTGDHLNFGFLTTELVAAFDSDHNGRINGADAFSDVVGGALILDVHAAAIATGDPSAAFFSVDPTTIKLDHVSQLVSSDFII